MPFPNASEISYYELKSGHRLAYRVLGPTTPHSSLEDERRPLVLIHGLTAVGLVDWEPLASCLARKRKVLIFDNRGIGWSRPVSSEKVKHSLMTMEGLADDTAKLIEHVGFESVDILGFSMGGNILQHLLVRHNSLAFDIRHAILASTFAVTPKLASAAGLSARDLLSDVDSQKLETTRQFWMAQYDADWLSDVRNKKTFEERLSNTIGVRRPMDVIFEQIKACQAIDLRSKLKKLPSSIPILSIHGTKDQVVGIEERALILDSIAHIQIASPPSTAFGHMWYDYFGVDVWEEIIDDFLSNRSCARL